SDHVQAQERRMMYTAEQSRAVFEEIFQNDDPPLKQLADAGVPEEATADIVHALSEMLVTLVKEEGMGALESHLLLQTTCLLFGFKLGKSLGNSNGHV